MCFIKVDLLSEREKFPLTCTGRPVRMGSSKKVKARPRTRKSPPTASPIVFGQGSNSSPSKLCPPSQTPPTSIRRETTKRLLLQTGISLSLYISISQSVSLWLSCERGIISKKDKAKGLLFFWAPSPRHVHTRLNSSKIQENAANQYGHPANPLLPS